jgi:predicted RNA-binding protein with TRAM domain
MKARQAVLGALAASVTLTMIALVFAVSAAADPATEIPFEFTFDDVNPCTGDIHTVTIEGTTSVHEHDGRMIAYSDRTITTSPTGFVGHGTDTEVDNGQVFVFRLADIATNPSGDRFRAEFVIVVDLSTGTTRVERGELTCLGP